MRLSQKMLEPLNRTYHFEEDDKIVSKYRSLYCESPTYMKKSTEILGPQGQRFALKTNLLPNLCLTQG